MRFSKYVWALFNLIRPAPVLYPVNDAPVTASELNTLVILIDYDKFMHRSNKTVGATTYPCGRPGLDHIIDFCIETSLSYINVITTDDSTAPLHYNGDMNRTMLIKNGGSDIAALVSLSEVVQHYEFVIVANSSANVHDALKVGNLWSSLKSTNSAHFVIGFNGNSSLSPRLPFSPRRTPHIITNIFASRAADLLATLAHAKRLPLYSIARGYSNKYFAIRYFEILLSLNAVANNGELILLTDSVETIFSQARSKWPKIDSRLSSQ